MSVDRETLYAWLAGRSIARELPQPVCDFGGFRVDTHCDDEVRRWVFPQVSDGLGLLARRIKEPGYLLKLCGGPDELESALPRGWHLHTPAYFMAMFGKIAAVPLVKGYALNVYRNGLVIQVLVKSDANELAASGYAADTENAFIYDRIVTAPEHRRKGLGRAVMAALYQSRLYLDTPQLLVATEDGRALYLALGWSILSPYSTASIPHS